MVSRAFFGNGLKCIGFSALVIASVAAEVEATPLSWDLRISSPAWIDEIQVTEAGSTVTVRGYGTTGPGFSLERARITALGPRAGIGVCNNNEARVLGNGSVTCAAKQFINRGSVRDDAVYDFVFVEFDRRMSGRLQLLIGGDGARAGRNNFWFGRGLSPALEGLTFTDLKEQYELVSTGINIPNGFGYNHPSPSSGEDYDWFLMSPGGLGSQFYLSVINGTEAEAPVDPVAISSPATYPLFAVGAALLLLVSRRRLSSVLG